MAITLNSIEGPIRDIYDSNQSAIWAVAEWILDFGGDGHRIIEVNALTDQMLQCNLQKKTEKPSCCAIMSKVALCITLLAPLIAYATRTYYRSYYIIQIQNSDQNPVQKIQQIKEENLGIYEQREKEQQELLILEDSNKNNHEKILSNVDGYLKVDNTEKVKEILGTSTESAMRRDILCKLAEYWISEKKFEEAFQILTLEDFPLDQVDLLHKIGESFLESNTEKVYKILTLMNVGQWRRRDLAIKLANTFFKTNNFDQFYKAMQDASIKDSEQQNHIYGLVEELIKNNDIEKAKQLVQHNRFPIEKRDHYQHLLTQQEFQY